MSYNGVVFAVVKTGVTYSAPKTRLRTSPPGTLSPHKEPRDACQRPGLWPTRIGRIDMYKDSRHQTVTSRRQALLALGQVVYAVRVDNGWIKIGCTKNLDNRLHVIRHQANSATAELLALFPGNFDDEAEIHTSLAVHRVAGKREYYHPTPGVMATVAAMQGRLNLSASS